MARRTMARKTTVLVVLLAVVIAVHAAAPTASPTSTTATTNRGRGTKRMFVSRPRPRAIPSPSPRALLSPSPTPTPTPSSFTPTSAAPTASSFSPTPRQSAPTFAPTFSPTFAPTPFPTPFTQTVVRIPGPSPTTRVASQDVFVAPRRASAPLAFSPRALAPQHAQIAQHQAPISRPRGTAVPIVALKFHLNEDGTYSTSSETGDGTVRQEQGIFNGAGMAVKGMYAYTDLDVGPVQVNYIADEYGFQPQGPNIHPAILQAVAEQVHAARTAKTSAKSRHGALGLNGLENDGELDYDEDNGAGTSPAPIKYKSRAVRRVVVRRL